MMSPHGASGKHEKSFVRRSPWVRSLGFMMPPHSGLGTTRFANWDSETEALKLALKCLVKSANVVPFFRCPRNS